MKLTRTQIAALEAVKRGEVFLDCKTGNFLWDHQADGL